jgi:phosphoglycolate phosphatase-like HAD superfamily hydrolase
MPYKAIIFDLDGTLVHTKPDYRYLVVRKTLRDLGTAASKEHIDLMWFGTNRSDVVRRYFNVEPEKFWKLYRCYDTAELRKQYVELYGDVDFIQELRKKGFKTGIFTGAPEEIASLEIGMLGEEKFDAIVNARSSLGITPKPSPHGLLECLNKLKIDKNEAMCVGNADEDIVAAKEAGVFDVLLLRGEYELHKVKPSLTVNSLYELRTHIGIAEPKLK